jgi:hypothetical protein
VRDIFVSFDETLPIVNKPKQPRKGEYKEQNERIHIQKTKEPRKRANHKGNIKYFSFEDQSFFFSISCRR